MIFFRTNGTGRPYAQQTLPVSCSPKCKCRQLCPLGVSEAPKLHHDANPTVLINAFDALEPEALRAVTKFKSTGVGPLFPTAFLGGKDPSDTSFGGDLFRRSKDYIEWLNSNPESSVIYVSFGSLAVYRSNSLRRLLVDCWKVADVSCGS